jgi:hypothetical protein
MRFIVRLAVILAAIAAMESAAPVSASTVPGHPASPEATELCTVSLYRELGRRPVDVGATYVTKAHIGASFAYRTRAVTVLEIGLSPSPSGPFNPDGTTAITATAPGFTASSSTPGYRWYQTYFRFGEWKRVCVSGTTTYTTYEISAYRFSGGLHVVRVKTVPAAPFCRPTTAGVGITVDGSRAATFPHGFTAGGFSGSAQTGWSPDAAISYTWHARGHVCGSTKTVPLSPVLVAN